MNLVDLLKGQLGGANLSKLGSAVGLDGDSTNKALGAALPALLGTLGNIASTPEGARKLNEAVDKADDGILSNLGNSLTGGSASSLLSAGSGVLSSLLGGGMLGGIVAAIVKFTGLGNTAVSGLLGLLTPMVLGALKGQKKSLGLDASGLANMLIGQKANIASAMPSGLGSLLGSVPGLSAFADAGKDATRAVADTAARATTYRAPEPVAEASSPMKWLLPLLLLAGLGLLAWSFLGNKEGDTPRAPAGVGSEGAIKRAEGIETDMTAAMSKAAAAMPASVTSFFTDATAAVNGIKDAASADTAVASLTKLAEGLPALKTAVGALPAESKAGVQNLIKTQATALLGALEKAAALPGVGDKLKPVTDAIRTGLAAVGA